MAFHFSLVLLVAILLNDAVLGDDSTSGGALAGADGERNAPSRGGEAGCKSEGRARNGDKLVVLNSAPTTPSETVRKSASVVRRMSGQSSLRSRNEARNNHVGVGNEPHDHPATSHEAQTSVDDKHGMKLPHVRRPAASRHSEGGLTPKNPKESAGVVDRKKEFESMVNGIIAEEAQAEGYSDPKGSEYCENNGDYGYGYGDYRCTSYGGESGDRNSLNSSPSVSNNSTSGSVSSSTTSTASSSDGDQNSLTGNKDEGETNNNEAQKDVQEKEEKDGKEKGEKQLNEQKSHENSNGQETNNSSDDAENEKAPSSGNSALLCGSYSSVLLVAVACLCAFAY